jgi:hypothetical protein
LVSNAIGWTVFLFGAAYGHIKDMMLNNNNAINNSGALLWIGDIALPLIILILAIIYIKNINKNKKD